MVKEVTELSKQHDTSQVEEPLLPAPQSITNIASIGPELIRKNTKAAMRRKGTLDPYKRNRSHGENESFVVTSDNENNSHKDNDSSIERDSKADATPTRQHVKARVSAFPDKYQYQLDIPDHDIHSMNSDSNTLHTEATMDSTVAGPSSAEGPVAVLPRIPKAAAGRGGGSSSSSSNRLNSPGASMQARNTQLSVDSSWANRDSDVINQNVWNISNRTSRTSDQVRSTAISHSEGLGSNSGYHPYHQQHHETVKAQQGLTGSQVFLTSKGKEKATVVADQDDNDDENSNPTSRQKPYGKVQSNQRFSDIFNSSLDVTKEGAVKRLSRTFEDKIKKSIFGGDTTTTTTANPTTSPSTSFNNNKGSEGAKRLKKQNLLERRGAQGFLKVDPHSSKPTGSNNQQQQPTTGSSAKFKEGLLSGNIADRAEGSSPSSSSVPFSPYLKEALTPVIGDPSKILSVKRKSRASSRPLTADELIQATESSHVSPVSMTFGGGNNNNSGSSERSKKKKSVDHSRLSYIVAKTAASGAIYDEEPPKSPGKKSHTRSATVSRLDHYDQDLDNEDPEKKALANVLIENFPAISTPNTETTDVPRKSSN